MGANYGYPDCFAVWLPNWDLETGQQFALNPNETYGDAECNSLTVPARLTF